MVRKYDMYQKFQTYISDIMIFYKVSDLQV